MKLSVPPFRTAKNEHVEFSGWFFPADGEPSPLPDELEVWDYQTTIQLTSRIDVNLPDLLSWCNLGAESRIGCLVTAKSSKTTVDLAVSLVELRPAESQSVALSATIPGLELGGRLTIATSLVVLDSQPLALVSPRQPGSVLWSARDHTHLQGVGSQFPTYAESFNERYPDFKEASWFLHMDTTDLDASFLSSVRLILNADKPQIRKLLQGGKDSTTQLLRRTIDTDVTRQIVQRALAIPEILDVDADFEESDLLHGLRNCLQMLWPEQSAEHLVNEHKHSPWTLEAKIQASRKLV